MAVAGVARKNRPPVATNERHDLFDEPPRLTDDSFEHTSPTSGQYLGPAIPRHFGRRARPPRTQAPRRPNIHSATPPSSLSPAPAVSADSSAQSRPLQHPPYSVPHRPLHDPHRSRSKRRAGHAADGHRRYQVR